MGESLSEKVLARIGELLELNYRLLLVVDPSIARKTSTPQEVAGQTRAPLVYGSRGTSKHVLNLAAVDHWAGQLVASANGVPLEKNEKP